ncbi:ATP-dependent zinc metalloprotease FtsH [Candidatus Uhrbacteria bacterium]|nr:ATP-dependent zinc metalloprotease FtsH [Candidatus Uhrbacteria bacterium]
MNQTFRNILIFVGCLALIGVTLSFVNLDNKSQRVDLTRIARDVQDGNIASITIRGSEVEATLKDKTVLRSTKESTDSLSTVLKNYGVSSDKVLAVPVDVKDGSGASYWLGLFLQNILPVAIVIAFMFFLMRSAQGQNNRAMMFGSTNVRDMNKDGEQKITFKDVAGVKEAKEELSEIVEFLKQPDKFTQLGAKIPKGVLLMGSPGTGKTLLARAVAGEAGVPFFQISGSEFVEMFVGVGASRVRDLFAKAKKEAPCIIFIDEIDAVGRQRGSGVGGSHDEREQTLNQILVEMDGFEANNGVIVIAATNRPDVLDSALLRPGRFDRRVTLDPPDINDREEILKVHARNKPMASVVDLRILAQRTPGFTGADLMNLLNEAAILGARKGLTEIPMQMLLDSIEKVLLGPERKSHVMNDEERRVTAYHEAGHALVAHLLPHADPVHKVSIISRGRAAGYTLKMPTEDRSMRRREEYKEDIAVMLGGYAAEFLIFNDITTGASSDMKSATRLARNMVTQWGMSTELGPRVYGEREDMISLGREIHESRDYSESKAQIIDSEIDRLISEGLIKAKELISNNLQAMDRIVKALVVAETLERSAFNEAIGLPPANIKNSST